jgi:hypothetical protein
MTFEDRVQALQSLGFTARQTRFIATVALHSGYCLRRQYATYAGIRYGKNVCDFLESLVRRGFAERFIQRADRGAIYHLHARAIYRLLGQHENRNRREASAALIARKVMVLDYLLAHPEPQWVATEQDKVDLFVGRYGVPPSDLPHRVFGAAKPGASSTTRAFIHKLPIGLVGEPAVPIFVCLVTDTTGRAMEQFLTDHRRLFAWLPAWTVVATGPSPAGLLASEVAFARHLQQPSVAVPASHDDLRWFFQMRQTVDSGDLAGLSVAAIDRFRTLREAFRRPIFDELYLEWKRVGEGALTRRPTSMHPPKRSVGTLLTELLPFDYSQFGSLPGVA